MRTGTTAQITPAVAATRSRFILFILPGVLKNLMAAHAGCTTKPTSPEMAISYPGFCEVLARMY